MGDNMKYTKCLKKGDTIGLIAPAGPLRNIRIEDIKYELNKLILCNYFFPIKKNREELLLII